MFVCVSPHLHIFLKLENYDSIFWLHFTLPSPGLWTVQNGEILCNNDDDDTDNNGDDDNDNDDGDNNKKKYDHKDDHKDNNKDNCKDEHEDKQNIVQSNSKK